MSKEKAQHGKPGEPESVPECVPQAEYDALYDKFLRLGADFENYKKRVQKEREDLLKYAGESFVLELLRIVDDFERAFQAADTTQDFKVLHKGVEMILKDVQDFLKEKGVRRIEAVGKTFDPHIHDAVDHVSCQDKEENTIVEELQSGYELNGRVVRAAKVRVCKKEEKLSEPKEEGPGAKEEKKEKKEEER